MICIKWLKNAKKETKEPGPLGHDYVYTYLDEYKISVNKILFGKF